MTTEQDIHQDLLAVVYRHIPAERWQAAQEAAAAADIEEGEMYGEHSGKLDDLQARYRWMVRDTQDLAEIIALLRLDIDAVL